MPTKSRGKNTSVIDLLKQQPQGFDFLQAIRLIERSAAFKNRSTQLGGAHLPPVNAVAKFTPPNSECVRFRNRQSLSYPVTEINHLDGDANPDNIKQWEIYTSFLGLTGSHGVLPFHYTEMILQRIRQKDPSLMEFFDLFNHRIISLFYQASLKYKLPLEYERKRLTPSNNNNPVKDSATQLLNSIIGFGTRGLHNRLAVKDESLIYYGGLFSQQIRTASGLKQILSSYFGIPVKLEEFLGRWQELIDDIRTRLPDKQTPKGQNVCLGRSAMLGNRGWFAQGKIRIVLGPLNREQFYTFSPGSRALKALNELVRTYIGVENDYDFNILVNRADIPDKVTLDSKDQPIMGWNTWLASKPKPDDESNTMKISISASRLN